MTAMSWSHVLRWIEHRQFLYRRLKAKIDRSRSAALERIFTNLKLTENLNFRNHGMRSPTGACATCQRGGGQQCELIWCAMLCGCYGMSPGHTQ
jgi:hypothetical protein